MAAITEHHVDEYDGRFRPGTLLYDQLRPGGRVDHRMRAASRVFLFAEVQTHVTVGMGGGERQLGPKRRVRMHLQTVLREQGHRLKTHRTAGEQASDGRAGFVDRCDRA